MLKIRLARGGAKKRPYYYIVVADSHAPRDGKFIERVGTYNPMLPRDGEQKRVNLKTDRTAEWLGKGAQPTDRVARFLSQDEALAGQRAMGGSTPPDPIAAYTVHFEPLAEEQAAWIEARTGFGLRGRITATLLLGPQPHAYRRIRRDGADFRLKVKEWRVQFALTQREVRVLVISSGFRPAEIAKSAGTGEDPLAVHRDFRAAWK